MSEEEEPLILRSQDARGVVTLTLNRPRFNALSEAMLAELQRELDAIASDESVRVVVIAAKAKLFARVTTSKKCGPIHRWSITSGFLLMLRDDARIQRLPVPVIARVQGIATAAGCQLVAMCDLAVASSTARFAVAG
jgi:Enoyl-CoA hydratase/carnithine racemase